MKLLLVNTPIDQSSILGEFKGIYSDMKMIPDGLAYLASSARRHKIDVSIIDQYTECLSLAELEDRVRHFAPDLIGYGATTPNYSAALDLLKRIRSAFPEIKTVMGGNHPSMFPESVLRHREVDYVLRGEAEDSLPELCKALQGSGGVERILGLSYRDERGTVQHNPPSPEVALDALPWPAYDLLPMHLYSSPSYSNYAQPIYQMIASRGCPNRCAYCVNAIKQNPGTRYRRRPIPDVVDEMEMLADRYKARQIQFWDPIFPLGKEHALAFCDGVISRGLHKRLVWSSSTYADLLDEETISRMVKAGCRGIGFGIESGVPELLKSVNKKADLDKIRAVCKLCRRYGLTIGAGFILGFPGETPAMTRQTIDYAKSLDIHYAQFNIFIPYPGTPLYETLKERGELVVDENDADFVSFNQNVGLTENELIYVPPGRTSSELKRWQRRAYREFYLRPKAVWLLLPTIRASNILRMCKSVLAVLKASFSRHRAQR